MAHGFRLRDMEIAGVRMELVLAGRHLILARGTTMGRSAGAFWVANRGDGCRITTADGCSGREWAGFGVPVDLSAEAELGGGGR